MHKSIKKLFPGVEVIENPSQEKLREISLKEVPAIFTTKHGNLVRYTKRKARMANRTYIIAPESDANKYAGKVMPRDKAERLIELQRAHIEKKGKVIQIDGYLGNDPQRGVPIQWIYTEDGANVAGMQQVLAFPREDVETTDELLQPFNPLFRLIMTPDCIAEGMPDETAILVDLDNWITYVLNSDYFGESKKGMLRKLNEYVYRNGGLVLHAGAKEIHFENERTAMAVMGLSGTGKTTTTFSKQGELTRPIQDDMVVLWPRGEVSITENGCFAKTYGLKQESEPTIYNGTVKPTAWLENIYMDKETGELEFSKEILSPEEVKEYKDTFALIGESEENMEKYISGDVKAEEVITDAGVPKDGWDFVMWTKNGRSIIPMAEIKDAADLSDLPELSSIGILNRDEGSDAAMPGIIRFTSPEQAAAYFMLGETSKTSAAGKERGKTRSPFTQPFFPQSLGLQAVRFSKLMKTMEGIQTWLMNTGYVGGEAEDVEKDKALKVKIRHSSAMLEAMLSGSIVWKQDPDFSYQIVDIDHPDNQELLEKVPAEILNPKSFYEQKNRLDEYQEWVETMKKERKEFLKSYDVAREIVETVD